MEWGEWESINACAPSVQNKYVDFNSLSSFVFSFLSSGYRSRLFLSAVAPASDFLGGTPPAPASTPVLSQSAPAFFVCPGSGFRFFWERLRLRLRLLFYFKQLRHIFFGPGSGFRLFWGTAPAPTPVLFQAAPAPAPMLDITQHK